uniref:Apple domain-containing protein n=1 Tax=Tetraselmis sp. GSL018 TaxID=582737 RepID=A0A061RD78_9CHLO
MLYFVFGLLWCQFASPVLADEQSWFTVKRQRAIKPIWSWNWQRRYYRIEDCFQNCKISNGYAYIVHNKDSGRCYCWPPAPYPGDLTVYSSDEDTYSLQPRDDSESDLVLYDGCGSYDSLSRACSESCSAGWIKKRVFESIPNNCRTPDFYTSLRTAPRSCDTDTAVEFRFDCGGYGDGFSCCCEGAGADCD